MGVHELNRNQLVELKQAMLGMGGHQPSYSELADADELITDEQVFKQFENTEFTEDDFSKEEIA